ncbi:MAG: M48 family metallopeptidase [Acidiferrobacteraceae bacterium]
MDRTHDHGALLELAPHGEVAVPHRSSGASVLLRALIGQILTVAALLAPGAVNARALNLPDLGEASSTVLSRQQERVLGAAFMRDARRTLPIVRDPEIRSYIQHFGERLVRASDDPKGHFHFFVIRNNVINAFSVPGAYVGIDSALILDTRNEDELAAVLSHEIAHVTQHHIARMLAQQKRLSLPAMGAMLAGILLAAAQPMAGGALLTTTSAAVAQNQLDYSRQFEAEADRVGIETLARAGFNPRAMPDFFERLQNWSRLNDAGAPPPFLQTHPVTSERISQSLNRANQYPNRPMQDDLNYELMRARLAVDTAEDARDAVDQFKDELARGHYRFRQAAQFGEGLARLRQGRFAEAATIATALVRHHPGVLAYQIMAAQVAAASGHHQQALSRYQAALRRHPDSIALLELYAEELLDTHHPHRAARILRRLLRRDRSRAHAYRMLARAAADTGDAITLHRSLARYYYLDDRVNEALEQLHLAASAARKRKDQYMLARITARIKQIRRRRAEMPPLPN